MLLYLLGAHARYLQVHREHERRPKPILGIFMDGEKVSSVCCIYIYIYYYIYMSVYILQSTFPAPDSHCRSEGEGGGGEAWSLTFFISHTVPICDGGLVEIVMLAHKFMSMTVPGMGPAQ